MPRLATTDNANCLPGTSEGGGNVAFGWAREHHSSVFFFGSSGGTARGSLSDYDHAVGNLIGQLDGFEGVYVYPGSANQQWELDVVAGDGKIRKVVRNNDPEVRVIGATQANDPTGGVMVLGGSPSVLISFDAAGNVRWRREVALPNAVLGVDRLGNALLLAAGSGGTTEGQWVDHAGNVGKLFDAKVAFGFGRTLWPRVGSGLFLRASRFDASGAHSDWIWQFESLAATGAPAPAWLLARPETKLAMARGGRAYALLPEGSSASCAQTPGAQTAEVIAPSGKSCGAAKFTDPQASCSLEVGYDGTVLQQVTTEESRHNCSMRWWPGLLR
ncbi:MAG: hypothetical protein NVSMB23_29740 [Myxococcales bacterium]